MPTAVLAPLLVWVFSGATAILSLTAFTARDDAKGLLLVLASIFGMAAMPRISEWSVAVPRAIARANENKSR